MNINSCIEKILYVFECDKSYYLENRSIISDFEYDKLNIDIQNFLSNINHNDLSNKEINIIERYNSRVGFAVNEDFVKIEHIRKMHSLSNVFDNDELQKFSEKINRFLQLDLDNSIEYSVEPKIDGLSFSAVYKNGKLDYVATRGDGIVGENITKNAIHIKDFPIFIETKKDIEVRGEVFVSKDDFKQFNQMNGNKFSNPRNFASGTLRNLNPIITLSRNLRYFAYDLNFLNQDYQPIRHSDSLSKLKDFGFSVNDLNTIAINQKDLISKCSALESLRFDLPYEIDGIVIKVNEYSIQSRLGFISRYPRWACALKFSGKYYGTKLLDVFYQVGRTGSITPIAILEKIKIDGVTVSRATLHNFYDIEKKHIKKGDIVEVSRAGDVIPFVKGVIETFESSQKISIPQLCPSCHHELTIKNEDSILRCRNKKCSAIMLESIKYFVSKPCFNISGLGKSSIEDFFKNDIIKSVLDVFKIERYKEKIISMNGWSHLSYNKLIKSINEKKSISFDRFILSLGLRYVGVSTSSIIAEILVSIENLIKILSDFQRYKEKIISDLLSIDGIGDAVVDGFIEFCSNEENLILIQNLLEAGVTITYKKKKEHEKSILFNKKILFTGKLSHHSRIEAKIIAEERFGAKVVSSISKELDFLIAGEGSGSKLKKAQELGIKVLYSTEWDSICNL